MNTQAILEERGKTHGEFRDNTEIAQALKSIIEADPSWPDMPSYQRESLHMICHKIARIIAGNSNFIDHWADIAGYAELVIKELQREWPEGTDTGTGLPHITSSSD